MGDNGAVCHSGFEYRPSGAPVAAIHSLPLAGSVVVSTWNVHQPSAVEVQLYIGVSAVKPSWLSIVAAGLVAKRPNVAPSSGPIVSGPVRMSPM